MRYGNDYKRAAARRKELAEKRAAGMIPTRNQERGTCQVCGRDVAVDGVAYRATGPAIYGTSKHGYTVEPGWGFNGVCSGADKQPYETDFLVLENHITKARENYANLQNAARRYRTREIEVASEMVTDYNKPKSQQVTFEKRTAADFPRRRQYHFGEQTWEQFLDEVAERIEKDARGLYDHITRQDARLAAWVYAPEKIRTVKVEVT